LYLDVPHTFLRFRDFSHRFYTHGYLQVPG